MPQATHIQSKLASKTDFEKAILFYHMGSHNEAEDLFHKCQKICPEDDTLKFYLNRL